ncbi:MAG TPA: peptide ABC transporter substrate-binding protein [Pseudomonadales bacterium]
MTRRQRGGWRRTRCLSVLLAALLPLAIVTPPPALGEPAPVLRIGNAGEPATLDPHRYNLRLEETILTDLFLGLTTFDAHANVVPGAAERWQVSDDGLTWTFRLRDGLAWSDGTPLTAHDFVYSLRRLLDPATAASLAYFLYPLKNAAAVNAGEKPVTELGVHAPDDATLVLTLEKPYPYLPERLLYPTGYPVPRHVIERVGDAWVEPEHWVSNGAYVLEDWQPQASVTLRRNPRFADSGLPPAHVERVVYLPLASEQNAYNRYRAGDVHAIASFPAGQLDAVRDALPEHLRLSPLLSIMYLVFDTRRPPFDDARVREALALAIDRETLTDTVQRAGNVPSASFVPSLVSGYEPVPEPHAGLPGPERMARARALLEAAGYGPGNPLEITLRYISGTEQKRTSLAIAAFWQQLGVRTRLHQAELKVHFSDLRQGNFQVAIAGWFGESNPEHYLGLLKSDTGDVNYGGYRNPEFDAQMNRAAAVADLATRNRLLRDAEAIGIADFPVVPLYSVTVRRLVHPDLAGWYDNPRDAHPARFLHWR